MYDDIKKIKEAFKDFTYIGLKKTIDEYYYDPLRDNLKPDKKVGFNHCLRLRQKMMNIQLLAKMMFLKMVNGYILMNMKQKLNH